jgi:hypothetical protein
MRIISKEETEEMIKMFQDIKKRKTKIGKEVEVETEIEDIAVDLLSTKKEDRRNINVKNNLKDIVKEEEVTAENKFKRKDKKKRKQRNLNKCKVIQAAWFLQVNQIKIEGIDKLNINQ